uniref:Uncharacterized protein n=1 Tax=Rhizophora mucronata TaxID=61149 RepID=A0A2P2QFW1_RHIMU
MLFTNTFVRGHIPDSLLNLVRMRRLFKQI